MLWYVFRSVSSGNVGKRIRKHMHELVEYIEKYMKHQGHKNKEKEVHTLMRKAWILSMKELCILRKIWLPESMDFSS